MANEFRVRKGLIVNGSGSVILDVLGSQGELFSVTDELSGSLFSVNDISGIPILEVFSDNRVNVGTYNLEAIKVSGSFARVTGSLFGTASWAQNATNAISSSYPIAVTGNSIYSTAPVDSIYLGTNAGSGAINSNYSNFLGSDAGNGVLNANFSNFFGYLAGSLTSASSANFLGSGAGYAATNAAFSNFIGSGAGYAAVGASYSNLFGYYVGRSEFVPSIGRNNIIIGTRITLGPNRVDSINLGGLIFGTGSYFSATGNPFSGSANGRIGINEPFPTFNLDVSGSGRYTTGLTVTGSLNAPIITGSLFGTASFATTASYSNNIYNSDGTLTGNRTVTSNGFVLSFAGSNTAATNIARGINVTHTLVAAANDDTLVDIDIVPTFTNGAFTGIRNYSLRSSNARISDFNIGANNNANESNANFIQKNIATNIALANSDTGGGVAIWSGTNASPISRVIAVGNGDIWILPTTGVIIGGTTVNTSATLQIDSTTKGFLPPRMTETQKNAISTPATGLIIYQTDGTEGIYQYKSTGWSVVSGGGGGSSFPYTGSAIISGSLQVTGSSSILGSGSRIFTISGSTGTLLEISDGGASDVFSVSSGSVEILRIDNTKAVSISGSLIVTGSITGSLLGTASYATQALSSSYATQALSSSYAITASYALNAGAGGSGGGTTYPVTTAGISIADPTSAEDVTLLYTSASIVVAAVEGVLRGSAVPTASINLRYDADRNATGTLIVSASRVTSTTTGNNLTLTANTTVPAGNFVWLETTLIGGTVNELFVGVLFASGSV